MNRILRYEISDKDNNTLGEIILSSYEDNKFAETIAKAVQDKLKDSSFAVNDFGEDWIQLKNSNGKTINLLVLPIIGEECGGAKCQIKNCQICKNEQY